ncbi:MAG TPA: hypothetical protein VM050_09895 [Patescibacteria group bacterium]|nr:hypothetical protein [Patescibacteria group bacterium]
MEGFDVERIGNYRIPNVEPVDELPFSLPEVVSYMVAVMGTFGDQLTTRIGLSMPGLCEANPLPAFLMRCGLWLPFDAMMVVLTIGLPALFIRRCTLENRWVCLSLPLLFGTARLLATVLNLRLIL